MNWLAVASHIAFFALGWTAALYRVRQRESRRRSRAMELRRAVDLSPSEFSSFWQERG